MKKIVLFVLLISIVLVGCGNDSAYSQMKKDIKDIKIGDSLKRETTIISGDEQVTATLIIDDANGISYINAAGDEMYISPDTAYINTDDIWESYNLSKPNYKMLYNIYGFEESKFFLPPKNEVISTQSGIKLVDDSLNGKTYETIFTTDDNNYTIIGLEDYVTVTITPELFSFILENNDTGFKYIFNYSPGGELTIPQEAIDAKELHNNNLDPFLYKKIEQLKKWIE